jgi:hypothetical protein
MHMLSEAPADGDDSAFRFLVLLLGVAAAAAASGLLTLLHALRSGGRR